MEDARRLTLGRRTRRDRWFADPGWAGDPLLRCVMECSSRRGVARAAGGGVRRGRADPIAIMLGSAELLRAWVLGTLAGLADDNEHHARLRETLLVFLRTGGFVRRLPGS